jgi:acyl carrier protein
MTYKTIRRLLAEILGMDEALISSDTRLWHEVDAVSLAKLIILCERHFKITIHDECAPRFGRVRDLTQYVEQLVSEGRDDYVLPSDSAREAWYYE